MNFELEDKLNEYVKQNDLESAIQIAESELRKIPQNWLSSTDWNESFARKHTRRL